MFWNIWALRVLKSFIVVILMFSLHITEDTTERLYYLRSNLQLAVAYDTKHIQLLFHHLHIL